MADELSSDEELRAVGFAREEVAPDENHANPGRDADHEWGVQYQGPFESATDGSARAVRLHARALERAGVPVLLQSFSNSFIGPDGVLIPAHAMDEKIKAETHDMRHRSIRSMRLRIKHLVVSRADQLRAYIIPNSVQLEQDVEKAMAIRDYLYKTTIVYSVWERTVIDDSIVSILRRVGECWVPCEENKGLLQRHGIERVVVVPHPWERSSDMAKLTARPPQAYKNFYAIGLWQPRKQFHETIGAFFLAFRPGEPASLSIKTKRTNFPNYPSPEESGKFWLNDPRVKERGWTSANAAKQVRVWSGEWPEDQITKLHFESNIYVCASRGEAYCFEAGTPIDTENGPVAIEKLREGDLVYTHKGRLRRVTHVMRREYSGEMVQVRPKGCAFWISSTPEHPYFVSIRRGNRFEGHRPEPQFLAAATVAHGDLLAVARRKPAEPVHSVDEDEENFYLPVAQVRTAKYKGIVYNIAVEQDESYAVRGYSVHNCLPAFDAKVAGNRMILVGYNGARDFSGDGDRLIPYEMKPVPKEYGWEENATWAEATPEAIAEAMASVKVPTVYERPPALEKCTMEEVGELMKKRCETVLARARGES